MTQVLRFRELEDDSGYRLIERAGIKTITRSLEDAARPGAIYLVPGRLLTPEHVPVLRRAVRQILAVYAHCFLYSPFALEDLAPLLGCAGTFRILRESGTTVQWQATWVSDLPTSLTVVYAGIVQTSYLSGLQAVGENEEPVLVSYRPSSAQGQAMITTMLVASPNIRTREAHRRAVLKAILDHLAADAPPTPPQAKEETATVPREVVNTVVLALYCGIEPSPTALAHFALDRLGVRLGEEVVIAALTYAKAQDVLGTDETPIQERLEAFVVDHNLDSLARMLRDER